ncbi:hypothetical protein HDV00_005078 [Rhizophlyctis rosea]|nr:hypothetical protein HDV00_005078 [Rhizophlyctis rosea]
MSSREKGKRPATTSPEYLHPLLKELQERERKAAEEVRLRNLRNSPIAKLPHELISMIFLLTDVEDQLSLLKIAMVCRLFNICVTPLLYRYPKFANTFQFAQFNQTLIRALNTRKFGLFVQVLDLSSSNPTVKSDAPKDHTCGPRVVPFLATSGFGVGLTLVDDDANDTEDESSNNDDIVNNAGASASSSSNGSWWNQAGNGGHSSAAGSTAHASSQWAPIVNLPNGLLQIANHPAAGSTSIGAAQSTSNAAAAQSSFSAALQNALSSNQVITLDDDDEEEEDDGGHGTHHTNQPSFTYPPSAGHNLNAITTLHPPGTTIHHGTIPAPNTNNNNNHPNNHSNRPATLSARSNTTIQDTKTPRIHSPTSTLLQIAAHCPDLKYLSLANCPLTRDTLIKETGEYLSTLQYAPPSYLTRVIISPEDAINAIVKGCKGLLGLDLRGCEWVSDAVVRRVVRSVKGLRALHLGGCSKVRVQWQKLWFVGVGSEGLAGVIPGLE